MSYDYFYGNHADQFTFYRIPKLLFTEPSLRCISAEAKILYGLLLDRMGLSAANGWLDDQGRVFIIYTIEEMMEQLGCAEQKTAKLLSELEKKVGLIERRRQGLGKPNLIYVKNFVDNPVDRASPLRKSQILNCENHNSGFAEITALEFPKSQANDTEKTNDNDLNDTDTPFPSVPDRKQGRESKGTEALAEYESYQRLIERNLELDILKQNNPYDTEMLDEIMSIILDTVCSKRQYIRVAGDPFTFEETNVLCIYGGETKQETENALREMRELLTEEEQELRELTDSVLQKLAVLSDEAFGGLELHPDFDE